MGWDKEKNEKDLTNSAAREAMKFVSKDVRSPKVVRNGFVKKIKNK